MGGVKGDFQARFHGNVRVKLSCLTRLCVTQENDTCENINLFYREIYLLMIT
jgi:hypothetical protein